MNIALRPYLKSGVVLVGASVLVVAPLQIPPQALRPAQVTVAVQPAALQQAQLEGVAALRAFEIYAQALGDTAYGVSNWIGTTPAFLVDLARQVSEDPTKIPAALSAVIYRLVYLGPGAKAAPELARVIALPKIRESLLAVSIGPLLLALSETLPAPIGGREGLVVASGQALAATIASILTTLLPEPLRSGSGGTDPQQKLVDGITQSPVDQLTGAIAVLADAVGRSASNTAYWVGALPTVLASLTQQVIADPELLPNALSTVVYSLFAMPNYSPDVAYVARLARLSLLGGMVDPYIRAFDTVLPPPLGSIRGGDTGLVLDVAALVSDLVNFGLTRLPRPLPVVTTTDDQATVLAKDVVQERPDPLLELADAIDLVVSGLGNSAASVLNYIGSVPTELTRLAAVLRAHPEQLPNVLSSIVYGLVALPEARKEPAAKMAIRSISLLDAALTPLARNLVQLPGPIGSTDGKPGVVELSVTALAKTVNDGLRLLPDPVRAQAVFEKAFADVPDSPLDQFNADFQRALQALGESVASVADDLGAAPRTTVELSRAVANDPRLLPRALSTVAWEANSLREGAVRPVVDAVARLAPPPLGADEDDRGLVYDSFLRNNAAAERALSRLPERLPIGNHYNEPYLAKVSNDDPADAGVVTRKVKRPLVGLDLNAKAHFGSASAGRAAAQSDDDSTARHRPGVGKRSVADHIAKHRAERRAATATN